MTHENDIYLDGEWWNFDWKSVANPEVRVGLSTVLKSLVDFFEFHPDGKYEQIVLRRDEFLRRYAPDLPPTAWERLSEAVSNPDLPLAHLEPKSP